WSRGESLYLVPVDSPAQEVNRTALVLSDTVHWVRTSAGWRSETLVEMPEGPVHAHLLVDTASVPLLLTRAVLVLTGLLLALLATWFFSRLLCRDLAGLPSTSLDRFRSFRARLSVALFVFFLLPTLVF